MAFRPWKIKELTEPVAYTPEEIEDFRVFMRGHYAPVTSYLYLNSNLSHTTKLDGLCRYGTFSDILFYIKLEDIPLCINYPFEEKSSTAIKRLMAWRLKNGR